MFTSDQQFEDEVRRIARLLWPSAEFGGAELIDSRERDGIFESEDYIHCIECTVSRRKDKAISDTTKLDGLLRKLAVKHPTKFVRGWFITLDEPTADQRMIVKRYQPRLIACSYDQFRSKLIDARSYLDTRKKYPFGSVRDPKTDAVEFELDYVPLDIIDREGHAYSVDELAGALLQGKRITLTGDYGAGKSSTARQLFFRLGQDFWDGHTTFFPVLLNLRDHHGQTDPVEALERHARNTGFGHPASLVKAWRAGYATLLLDGFDEIASAGWAGITKRLRDLRYRSMELIRRFIRETPIPSGILVTGRAHFFDSDRELVSAIAVGSSFSHLQLAEFSANQMSAFLRKMGWKAGIPEWLPTRPLLLAYLAGRGLLPAAENIDLVSPAAGWNALLDRIAERESEIEGGIDPSTVRRLIETLATTARSTPDKIGPITAETIIESFKTVCGYPPDDRGAVLLQRLPGLGGTSAEDGSRVFVDKDYVEVARSGDIFRYIEDPYNTHLRPENWQSSLTTLGSSVVAYRCKLAGHEAGKISAAFKIAASSTPSHMLAADLMLVLIQLSNRPLPGQIYLREVLIEEVPFDDLELDYATVELQDSVIGCLQLAPDLRDECLPVFRRCHIGRVEGRTGEKDLPRERFIDCTFDEFENSANTTNAILALSLPPGTKVVLTILKKLFVQSGTGRKESALFRGLDNRAQQIVPDVLDLLRRQGFAVKSRQGSETIWLPGKTRNVRRRALTMLAAPTSTCDPLIEESKQMS